MIVTGGDLVTRPRNKNNMSKSHDISNLKINFSQLEMLKTITFGFVARRQRFAEPRNVLFVRVLIAEKNEHNWGKTFVR